MNDIRFPSYDLDDHSDTMINGSAVTAADRTTGTLLVALYSDANQSSIGTGDASVSVIEIGPPTKPETLHVAAKVDYRASWGTWVFGWRSSTHGVLSIELAPMNNGQAPSVIVEHEIFDDNSGLWGTGLVTEISTRVLRASLPIVTGQTYRATVAAQCRIFAQGGVSKALARIEATVPIISWFTV
jgi:hypothetical protein